MGQLDAGLYRNFNNSVSRAKLSGETRDLSSSAITRILSLKKKRTVRFFRLGYFARLNNAVVEGILYSVALRWYWGCSDSCLLSKFVGRTHKLPLKVHANIFINYVWSCVRTCRYSHVSGFKHLFTACFVNMVFVDQNQNISLSTLSIDSWVI